MQAYHVDYTHSYLPFLLSPSPFPYPSIPPSLLQCKLDDLHNKTKREPDFPPGLTLTYLDEHNCEAHRVLTFRQDPELLEKARVKKLDALIATLEVLGEPSGGGAGGVAGVSQKGGDEGTVEDTALQGLGQGLDNNTGEGDSQDPPKKSSPVDDIAY